MEQVEVELIPSTVATRNTTHSSFWIVNSCQTVNPKTRSAACSARLQKPPGLAVMAGARETKSGASIDQIPAESPSAFFEILTLPRVVRLLSRQMKLFSRFLLMTRSLQGREDFNPGLELVPVV